MFNIFQNLLSETHSTLKSLDSLESEVAKTCVEVGNIGNRFWALSDTQFVESRVYDDDDVTSPTSVIAELVSLSIIVSQCFKHFLLNINTVVIHVHQQSNYY